MGLYGVSLVFMGCYFVNLSTTYEIYLKNLFMTKSKQLYLKLPIKYIYFNLIKK